MWAHLIGIGRLAQSGPPTVMMSAATYLQDWWGKKKNMSCNDSPWYHYVKINPYKWLDYFYFNQMNIDLLISEANLLITSLSSFCFGLFVGPKVNFNNQIFARFMFLFTFRCITECVVQSWVFLSHVWNTINTCAKPWILIKTLQTKTKVLFLGD